MTDNKIYKKALMFLGYSSDEADQKIAENKQKEKTPLLSPKFFEGAIKGGADYLTEKANEYIPSPMKKMEWNEEAKKAFEGTYQETPWTPRGAEEGVDILTGIPKGQETSSFLGGNVPTPSRILTPEETAKQTERFKQLPSILQTITKIPETMGEFATEEIPERFKADYEQIIKPILNMIETSPGGEGLKQIERGGRELIAPLPDKPEFQLKTATMERIKKPWLLTINDVIEITRKKGEAVLRAMNPERDKIRETPSTVQSIYTAYPNMPPGVAASIATIYDIGRDPLFANVLEIPMTGIVKMAEFSVKKGIPITKETLPKLYEAFKGGFKEAEAKLTAGLGGVNPEAGFAGIPKKPVPEEILPKTEGFIKQEKPLPKENMPVGEMPEPIKPTGEEKLSSIVFDKEGIPKERSIAEAKDALAEAWDLRPDVKEAYRKELGVKLGRIKEAYKTPEGIKTYQETMGTLKGGMETAPEIGEKIKPHMDNLLKEIQGSKKILDVEKIQASQAIVEFAESGKLPQPNQIMLLEDVFGTDFVKGMIKKHPLGDTIMALWNLERTLQAGTVLDASATFVQNGIYAVSRPVTSAKALINSLPDWFSEAKFKGFWNRVYDSKNYLKIRAMGVELTDPYKLSKGLLGHEEQMFGISLFEKMTGIKAVPFMEKYLPTLGKGLSGIGEMAKATSRMYHSLINRVRIAVAEQSIAALEAAKLDIAKDAKIFEDVGKVINVSTARPELTSSATINKALSSIFYSPRNALSKFQILLNPVYYYRLSPPARKMAAGDFLKFVFGTAGLVGLAKWYLESNKKGTVETDPHSSDFGKMRIGDTRWNLWGGYQSMARTAVQVGHAMLGGGYIKTAQGEKIPLGEKYGPSGMTVLGRFFLNKLSPSTRRIVNRAMGEQAFKDETPEYQRFMGLWISDMLSAWKEMGANAIWAAGVPSFFGSSVQTYSSSGKKIKKEVSENSLGEVKGK